MAASKGFRIMTILLLLLPFVIQVSQALYPVNLLTNDLIPSLEGSTGFSINGSVYVYGGIDVSGPANEFFKINFDQYGNVVYNNINNQGPITAYSQTVVLSDNDSIAILGGYRPGFFPNSSNIPIRAELYSFSQNAWTTLPGLDNTNNGTAASAQNVPSHRQRHAATMASDGLIYIHGGTPGLGYPHVLIDSWVYDPGMGTFTNLSTPPFGLYRTTATLLHDNRIVYVGGAFGTPGLPKKSSPFQIDRSLIYYTVNDTWIEQPLNTQEIDNLNKTRGDISAVLGPEGRYIYYFAGYNMLPDHNDNELYYNDVLILDTQTWAWQRPNIPGMAPGYRGNTIAARINNEYILFAFGENNYYVYKNLDVLKLPEPVLEDKEAGSDKGLDFGSLKWVCNITTGETFQEAVLRTEPHNRLSKSTIIAISVVCSLIAIIIFLYILYRFSRTGRRFIFMLYGKIWNPRKGDPFWAEAIRLIFRIILLFLFIAFFVFIVIQVIQSPVSIYTTSEPAPKEGVEVPDIRFCFDGFSIRSSERGNSYPRIRCMGTDGNVACNDHISELNLSYHMPVHTGPIKCYLFHNNVVVKDNPNNGGEQQQQLLRLSEEQDEQGNSMPSITFVSIIGNASESQGRLYIDVYPAKRDPNRNIYLGEDMSLFSDQDVTEWKLRDMFTKTGYSFNPPKENGYIGFQQQIKQTLKDSSWNYVGFSSLYNSIPEVVVDYQTFSFPDNIEAGNYEVATIRLDISNPTIIIIREQRVYTLVNGLAFIGGLYGLFTAFLIAMFGYRAQSPFGFIYRWSVGPIRHSIYRGLKDGFTEHKDTAVPLMSPVFTTSSSYHGSAIKEPNKENVINKGNIRNPLNRDEENSYSAQQQQQQQSSIRSIEDRLQLLEDVLKSYYIDAEVFQKLDEAVNYPGSKKKTLSTCPKDSVQ